MLEVLSEDCLVAELVQVKSCLCSFVLVFFGRDFPRGVLSGLVLALEQRYFIVSWRSFRFPIAF